MNQNLNNHDANSKEQRFKAPIKIAKVPNIEKPSQRLPRIKNSQFKLQHETVKQKKQSEKGQDVRKRD